MLRFSYRVTGDKAVISMFSALSNLTPAELDREVVGPWARRTRAVLKSTPYPNERPGQVYIRTGQLANRWKTVQVGGQWHIVNEATDPRGRIYPVYVVGDEEGEDQAWMHEFQ